MAMRAISYDRMAVPLMGIPVDTVIVFTFVLGSSMAALAGVLFATAYPVLEPYMGALVGWKAFIAAVIGGIGEIRGAFAGRVSPGLCGDLCRRLLSRPPCGTSSPSAFF